MGSTPYRSKIISLLTLLSVFLLIANIQPLFAKGFDCVNGEGIIWMLKKGGAWKIKDDYGYYQALVFRKDGENQKYKVQIQILKIIEEPIKETKYEEYRYRGKVIKCFWLDEPGTKGYVHDIFFKTINDKLVAFTVDIEIKAMKRIVLRTVYLVKPDGAFKKMSPQKYTNISNNIGSAKQSMSLKETTKE